MGVGIMSLPEPGSDREPAARLPTRYGKFEIRVYPELCPTKPPTALVRDIGDPRTLPIVRVHSECLTGDVFGSLRCDCGPQLHRALRVLGASQRAVLIYLRQEGRGIGLAAKVRAYALQDDGVDTYDANVMLGFPPDLRTYEIAALILHRLGMTTIRLLTNNPEKVANLTGSGIRVAEVIPLVAGLNRENCHYLDTKRVRFGHRLPESVPAPQSIPIGEASS